MSKGFHKATPGEVLALQGSFYAYRLPVVCLSIHLLTQVPITLDRTDTIRFSTMSKGNHLLPFEQGQERKAVGSLYQESTGFASRSEKILEKRIKNEEPPLHFVRNCVTITLTSLNWYPALP